MMRPSLFECARPTRQVIRKELRQHQEHALDMLDEALARGRKRPLIQAPTGFGKTLLAARIIEQALERGQRVLFVTPSVSLIDQTITAFEAEGIHDIGAMQADHPRTNRQARVQIATIQTLARRRKPDADVVIVDEAHQVHESLVTLMNGPRWREIPFIGLSATPWTKGLGKIYDDLIIAATTAELIDGGYLSPFVVYAPTTFDLSGVRVRAGEYVDSDLSEAVDTPQLVGDVIETWLKRGENRPTLCYGVDRAHAKHLQERFTEAGVRAEYIDCFTEREDREAIFDRFSSGDTKVICNITTLTTGIDLDVRCIIDAHPTRSEMRYVQVVGRGLRTAPEKDKLIVLDHAGNSLRLGLVSDINHDRLDDGRPNSKGADAPEKKVPLPRLCEDCSAVIPIAATACPQCGTPVRSKSGVVASDGELVEFGSNAARAGEPTFTQKLTFMAELKGLADETNAQRKRQGKPLYSTGWPAVQFKEKFGHWPDYIVKAVPPDQPSLKTRQWIKSRQIAFAKARGGRHAS
jgi:superfamily II DNA or RNA helicase